MSELTDAYLLGIAHGEREAERKAEELVAFMLEALGGSITISQEQLDRGIVGTIYRENQLGGSVKFSLIVEQAEKSCPDCEGQGFVHGSDRILLCSRCDMSGETNE